LKDHLVLGKTARYYATNFDPYEDFTVLSSLKKGIVLQSLYWQDFFVQKIKNLYLLSFLILLFTIIAIGIHWYFTEKYHKGTGTIVPHYEPPRGLPPAEMDVILHEKITSRTIPATIVDLAVRGRIKITEKKLSFG
jgi:hypothetical protein